MVDVADFERELHVNVTGTFVTIKAAAPHLARAGGGALVAVSSIAAILTHPLMAAYSTSKAALDMPVRNAADQLRRFCVRVHGLRPGLVTTDTPEPLPRQTARATRGGKRG